jgi:hypothetical protein
MYGCALLANTGGICGVTIASVQNEALPTSAASGLDEWVGGDDHVDDIN